MRFLLLLACAVLAAAQSQTVPFFGNRTSINVCTSETTPMVFCSDREPQDFVGYEIALFEKARRQLGWQDSMLNWSCLEWDTVVDYLAAGDGTCDIGVAGLNVMSEYLDRGLIFTWPTYRNGLKVMVTTDESTAGYWTFMNAFAWEVWLAILLTAIGVAVVIWGVDRWATAGEDTAPPCRGLDDSAGPPSSSIGASDDLQLTMWRTLGRPMQLGELVGHSFPANLIILVYALMMLILVTLYTANTAANITAIRLETSIQGISDLPGKAVASWNNYVTPLQRRGVAAIGFPWDNVEDEESMFNALRSGLVRALVLDASFLEYTSATSCDLHVVGDQFDLFDQAVAFPRGFNNSELLATYNDILVELRESGEMEALIKDWVQRTPTACKTQTVNDASTKITFSQVAGLWILLAVSVGVALLLASLHQFLLWNARRVARTQWYRTHSQKLKKISTLARLRSWSGSRQGRGTRRGAARGGGPLDMGAAADAAVAAADAEAAVAAAAAAAAAAGKGVGAAGLHAGSPFANSSAGGYGAMHPPAHVAGEPGGGAGLAASPADAELETALLQGLQRLQQEQEGLAQQIQQLLRHRRQGPAAQPGSSL